MQVGFGRACATVLPAAHASHLATHALRSLRPPPRRHVQHHPRRAAGGLRRAQAPGHALHGGPGWVAGGSAGPTCRGRRLLRAMPAGGKSDGKSEVSSCHGTVSGSNAGTAACSSMPSSRWTHPAPHLASCPSLHLPPLQASWAPRASSWARCTPWWAWRWPASSSSCPRWEGCFPCCAFFVCVYVCACVRACVCGAWLFVTAAAGPDNGLQTTVASYGGG